MLERFDCEQNTPEWLEARRGLITASAMSDVLAKGQGKTRQTYMAKLIAERVTGMTSCNFYNDDMMRGHDAEPYAQKTYEKAAGVKVENVGFFRNFAEIGGVGYSPDGVIGDDGLVEFKSRADHVQVKYLLGLEKIPSANTKQVQTGLWVTGRKWCDYVCFNDYLPPFIRRIERDEKLISEMKAEVILLNKEIEVGAERIMQMIIECQAMPEARESDDIIGDFLSGKTEIRDVRA